MIETTKVCTAAFMKARNPWLFDVERRIKTEDDENVFFKAVAKIFFLKKFVMADLLTNGLHEKVMICYISATKCIYTYINST